MNAQRQLLFISQQHLEVPTEIRVLLHKVQKGETQPVFCNPNWSAKERRAGEAVAAKTQEHLHAHKGHQDRKSVV